MWPLFSEGLSPNVISNYESIVLADVSGEEAGRRRRVEKGGERDEGRSGGG